MASKEFNSAINDLSSIGFAITDIIGASRARKAKERALQNLRASAQTELQAGQLANLGAQQQAATIRVGGDIAAQGALLTASGFRQSAKAVQEATKFNLGIQGINLQRRLQATSRQFQRTVGKQLTQTAASGVSTSSKSSLLLRNEAMNIFTKAFLDTKIDAENQRRSQVFESQVQITNLENQARASEFQAQAERVLASNRAAEAEFQGQLAVANSQIRANTILSQR